MQLKILGESLNPGQRKFLQSRSPFLLLSGGFGSGKSRALCLKALQLKFANGLLPGLIIAETYGELFTNIVEPYMRMLEAVLPEHLRPEKRSDKSGRQWIQWPDGAMQHLRSADNPAGYAGINVAYLLGDELRFWSRRAYINAVARVRLPGAMVQRCFASTPEMGLIADEFDTGKQRHEMIRCSTRDNLRNLDPGYVEDLKASYSARLVRAYIDGEIVALEGAVYECFDPSPSSPWIVDYDWRAHKERKTILCVDPGFRKSAWIWWHEVAPTEWVAIHEMMPDETSDDACVRMVNESGVPVDEIWCDPAADQTQSTLGLDTIAMMGEIKSRRDAPIRYVAGPFRSIKFGVDKVRTLLGDPAHGLPARLKFARELVEWEKGKARGAIKDLAGYRYPEDKDNHAIKDEPLKDGRVDHSADAVRQFAVGMWLTSPLRNKDPKLRKAQEAGFKHIDRRAA